MHTTDFEFDDKLHWYKDAIIYELHIKAFMDSNNDGVGDFGGLLQKLDYLQELGVTAIWLLPFYPSPLRDDGYDIADYYSINPTYGTMEEFKTFLDEAHARNLKVITELVINHSSDQHPWFQRARNAPRDSPERNFYVWTDDPNQYKDVRIIFQDFEASNWTWDPVAQQYYWHRFFHHQPDLNYDNPLVQEEIIKILDYWCEMGVDGFRLDAVPYLFEREGTNGENLPETHAFLKKLRAHIDQKYPGTVFLAEANMWPEDSASYFGDGDECHMNYHFPVMPRMFMSIQMEDRYPITDIFDQTPPIPDNCQWAMFLRNHDELTLEMVTDEERDYMYKVYAKDPKARINLGIRHRLAPLMDNNRRKIELMNALLFSLPGTPVIYYGDEIGMGDNFYLGDRDGVRTPMQWNADRNAGFSKANPQQLYLPVILDPEYQYGAINVELQKANTSSLFWFMKQAINLRKKYKVFGRGDLRFIHSDNPKVLAFTRSYDNEHLLAVVNLSKFSQAVELKLDDFGGYQPTDIFSNGPFPKVSREGVYYLTLSAHSFMWLQLEKEAAADTSDQLLPALQLNAWKQIYEHASLKRLEEEVLPGYLARMKWFAGGRQRILNVSVKNILPVDNEEIKTALLLLEVNLDSRLPQQYLLSLAFINEDDGNKLFEVHPEAAIANLQLSNSKGYLCDGYYCSYFQKFLANSFRDASLIERLDSKLSFINTTADGSLWKSEDEKPKVYNNSKSYLVITYGNDYFLKLYRKVEGSINPEVEMTTYLSERKQFKQIPEMFGSIEWKMKDAVFTVGLLQGMLQNHGNGEQFMLERINNYIERILARDYATINTQLSGSLTAPLTFESLPEETKILLGSSAADFAAEVGALVANMHMAIVDKPDLKEFVAEDFSLHYQRSLYSGMLTLVRSSLQVLEKKKEKLPAPEYADYVLNNRQTILSKLQRIYERKLDVVKIRTHGNLKLKKISLTGRGIAINDFTGDPAKSYSERRIKRSPLRDVVSIIRSFYYVAYEGFYASRHMQEEEANKLLPFANLWAWYMSNFFLHSYQQNVVPDCRFFPDDKTEFAVLMETYLIEKSLQDVTEELNWRPAYSLIPLSIIQSVLEKGF